jgi:predicted O-linked N-acetylglucosamine transferase (SPINDLY family)
MSDQAIADQIRADRIDILVDLTMHMAGGRPLVFARKPAPVQVAFMAYPGTTGMAAMDYRLTDPYLDPAGTGDDQYTEQSIRLPDTFWCYDTTDEEATSEDDAGPEPGALPALNNGYVTFGSLNSFSKINDGLLDLWCRVLQAVDGSRLMLLAPAGAARRRTLTKLAEQGIGADRVEFVPKQPRRKYLAEYQRIDIGLDTLPYNGHTTSLDSTWMGVPVVTRIGRTVVGRAGWSLLSNLGLSELAARNDEQFVRLAAELANDLARLSELRRMLRPRMMESPLMDAKRFAVNVEAAYRRMWQEWCNDDR